LGHLTKIYQHIADILSFEVPTDVLETTLNRGNFDWDAIVVEGSKHLLLPTIYCRLKTKKLLHCLPDELKAYLEELTAINRNRNTAILKQAHTISSLFQEHHISHVFLKGTALLALGVFDDLGERMVGDIDILIEKHQVKEAFNLLRKHGYSETSGFNYQTIGFRHLDRLIDPTKLAAVELHDELFNQNHTHLLLGADMLKSKITVNDLSLPRPSQLLKHIILASQVIDRNYFYNGFNFKTAYDSLLIKDIDEEDAVRDLLQTKYGKAFLTIAQSYFKAFQSVPATKTGSRKLLLYRMQCRFPVLRWLNKGLKYSWHNVSSRLNLLFTNTYYRKYVLKRIFIFNN
jgi:hypothetical protein